MIAGHNGIGKSTILGLLANGSGMPAVAARSYFDRAYQGNLNEIVHLDYETPNATGRVHPNPRIVYDLFGEQLVKRCAITKRKTRKELRVVPRNDQWIQG